MEAVMHRMSTLSNSTGFSMLQLGVAVMHGYPQCQELWLSQTEQVKSMLKNLYCLPFSYHIFPSAPVPGHPGEYYLIFLSENLWESWIMSCCIKWYALVKSNILKTFKSSSTMYFWQGQIKRKTGLSDLKIETATQLIFVMWYR